MSLPGADNSPFVWKDFSRFVEVAPVELGWLVLWGHYHDMGQRRDLAGQQTYVTLAGARIRVGDAVQELTRDPALAAEALLRFDRTRFVRTVPRSVPAPL